MKQQEKEKQMVRITNELPKKEMNWLEAESSRLQNRGVQTKIRLYKRRYALYRDINFKGSWEWLE